MSVNGTMSGGGSGTAGVAPPANLTDLFNKVAIQKFTVDPSGSNIEMAFNLLNHTVAITVNGQTITVPFVH